MRTLRIGVVSLDSERGVVLPYVAVFLAAIVGSAALGIDIARIGVAANEAQTAADVSALAGAHALFDNSTPRGGAEEVLRANRIDGKNAKGRLRELHTGSFDPETGEFIAGGLPENAVSTVIEAEVTNVLAHVLGSSRTRVTKVALASFTGLSAGRPTLPLALGECHFEGDCFEDHCMPVLTQTPNNSNNTAWTAFFDNANTGNIANYMSPGCGGDGRVADIRIGDRISLNNGQIVPLLRDVDCMLDSGRNEFLIPVVECAGNFNQRKEVRGFATIVVDHVVTSGGAKGLFLRAIFRADVPGKLGGPNFGAGSPELFSTNRAAYGGPTGQLIVPGT